MITIASLSPNGNRLLSPDSAKNTKHRSVGIIYRRELLLLRRITNGAASPESRNIRRGDRLSNLPRPNGRGAGAHGCGVKIGYQGRSFVCVYESVGTPREAKSAAHATQAFQRGKPKTSQRTDALLHS
jgi:hypothetical protein